jgi:hypothetical protein
MACSTGKLIFRSSYLNIKAGPLKFLERIQGDIGGPILLLLHYPDHSDISWFTRRLHVCLLSQATIAFAKLINEVITLRAKHPRYQIKSIRL